MPFVVFSLLVGMFALVVKARSRAHDLEAPLGWRGVVAQILPAFKASGAQFAIHQFYQGHINTLYQGNDRSVFDKLWADLQDGHLPGVLYQWDRDRNGGNYPTTIVNPGVS